MGGGGKMVLYILLLLYYILYGIIGIIGIIIYRERSRAVFGDSMAKCVMKFLIGIIPI